MNADTLYDDLIHDARIATLQKAAPVDVAAAGMALALVESDFDENASGDGGLALGLWQFNTRVRNVSAAQLGDIGYQVGLFVDNWNDVAGIVAKGLKSIASRRGAGEEIDFQPARDVPHWFNVGWQYGAGGLWAWLSTWGDLSVAGFAAHREFIGKPVDDSLPTWRYSRRAKNFRAEYDKRVQNAPKFWNDVVGGSVESAAQIAQTTASTVTAGAAAAVSAAKDVANAPGNAAASVSGVVGTLEKAAKTYVEAVFLTLAVIVLAILLLIIAAFRNPGAIDRALHLKGS